METRAMMAVDGGAPFDDPATTGSTQEPLNIMGLLADPQVQGLIKAFMSKQQQPPNGGALSN